MSEKEVILTVEGLKRMEQELEHLKTVRRSEVAERIKQAREFGDISENSEYEDAKNEQAFIEGRILTLEKTLRNARVVDENAKRDVVGVGATVKLKDLEDDSTSQFTVVGSSEANPDEQKISNESPVGKALLGKKAGAVVEVNTPGGAMKFKILSIH